MDKKKVVSILEEIGTLLEIKGENPFKCRAYFNGARVIEQLEGDIRDWVETSKIKELKGIGKALANKITELVTTGRLGYYEGLKESIPPGLIEMLKIPQLGPRKIKSLYEGLCISTVGELEYACQENRLIALPGFGPKSQENILKGIELLKRHRGRSLYSEAIGIAEGLFATLGKYKCLHQMAIAGSLRRRKETVKDIDLIASADDPEGLMDFFTHLEQVEEIIAQGQTKSSIRLKSGIGADLRVVKAEEFPFALHHFTGSQEHNTALRRRAKGLGLKMNEYGLFRDGQSIPCRDEKDIFTALGLAPILPELRENTGEIEAASLGQLPQLLELKDIKGIFHVHSHYSDGGVSLKELARAAQAKGYQYIGISDHSQSAHYAHGLKLEDIQRQHEEVDYLNKSLGGIRLLKGIEVDILPDGTLDYADEVLALFDFVIASVHSRFKMTEEEMTARIIKALSNPWVTILGHPTGRLLLARDPYPVDMYRVIDAAARYRKLIEINASPYRLDLDWQLCKYAKERGVRLCIGPDAHSLEGLDDTIYGVYVARRGWLEPADVINTLPVSEIKDLWFADG